MRKENFIVYELHWKSTAPVLHKNADENEKNN